MLYFGKIQYLFNHGAVSIKFGCSISDLRFYEIITQLRKSLFSYLFICCFKPGAMHPVTTATTRALRATRFEGGR